MTDKQVPESREVLPYFIGMCIISGMGIYTTAFAHVPFLKQSYPDMLINGIDTTDSNFAFDAGWAVFWVLSIAIATYMAIQYYRIYNNALKQEARQK